MKSQILFRFKSETDRQTQTIKFLGESLKVSELKRSIVKQKNLNPNTEKELVVLITDQNPPRELNDNELLSTNSSVIIERRKPSITMNVPYSVTFCEICRKEPTNKTITQCCSKVICSTGHENRLKTPDNKCFLCGRLMPVIDEELDAMLNKARYFIIKSQNSENIETARRINEWSTTKTNQKKLKEAYEKTANVILIFSVNKSSKFQGFARMEDNITTNESRLWNTDNNLNLGGVFKIRWLRFNELSFTRINNLKNPLNYHEPIKKSRDTQELPPDIGRQICLMFEPDPHPKPNPNLATPASNPTFNPNPTINTPFNTAPNSNSNSIPFTTSNANPITNQANPNPKTKQTAFSKNEYQENANPFDGYDHYGDINWDKKEQVDWGDDSNEEEEEEEAEEDETKEQNENEEFSEKSLPKSNEHMSQPSPSKSKSPKSEPSMVEEVSEQEEILPEEEPKSRDLENKPSSPPSNFNNQIPPPFPTPLSLLGPQKFIQNPQMFHHPHAMGHPQPMGPYPSPMPHQMFYKPPPFIPNPPFHPNWMMQPYNMNNMMMYPGNMPTQNYMRMLPGGMDPAFMQKETLAPKVDENPEKIVSSKASKSEESKDPKKKSDKSKKIKKEKKKKKEKSHKEHHKKDKK